MPTYQWADLGLSTDFELPELSAGDIDGPADDWRVRRSDGRQPLRLPRRWFHRWRRPDGRRWLTFARHPGGYVLRFSGLADFDVRTDTREIHGYRAPATPAHTFNHLLLDQVLPLVAGGAQRLSLHASVVDVNGGAVAFLGATSQGKSTLAAALVRRGHAVMSDDCCVMRPTPAGLDVWPTYPGLRLFPETIRRVLGEPDRPLVDVSHYSTKQRIVPGGAGTHAGHRPVPLRCVYMLAPREETGAVSRLRVDERSRRDAVLDLVGKTFYLDVTDERRMREGFELATAAASSSPVRLLTVPWDLAALDSVADAILADLRR